MNLLGIIRGRMCSNQIKGLQKDLEVVHERLAGSLNGQDIYNGTSIEVIYQATHPDIL